MGSVLFCMPLYTMAGLRPGLGICMRVLYVHRFVRECWQYCVVAVMRWYDNQGYFLHKRGFFLDSNFTSYCWCTRTGPFLYFNLMTLLSVYGNLCLAYLLSAHLQSQLSCQLVFAGAVLPLQLLMSGYLVLIRTMPAWLSWGSALCPMYYYMAGVFRNEFYHNSNALGVSENELLDVYWSFTFNVTVHFTHFATVSYFTSILLLLV